MRKTTIIAVTINKEDDKFINKKKLSKTKLLREAIEKHKKEEWKYQKPVSDNKIRKTVSILEDDKKYLKKYNVSEFLRQYIDHISNQAD